MWSTRLTQVRALQERAHGLSAQGRVEEALATAREAEALGQRLRFGMAALVAPDLLHTRAAVLYGAGRLDEAIRVSRDAVDARRSLGLIHGDQLSRLSDSLELQANALTRLRRLDEAETISAEVLAMRARLPWPERARALLNRSATLLEAGKQDEGLAVALELVRGAVARPGSSGVSDPSFVQGLSNLGVLLRHNGRWSEALAVQDVAVSELRSLAALGGREEVADLAQALANQALMQLECGHPEAAVAPGEEALALREDLAAASGGALDGELSESLNNQAVLLHKLERHEEAERVARRCVDLRRRLHAAHPGAFERRLANALATHAEMLFRCGRADEAVGPAREAVDRFIAMEEAEPGHHTLWLAGGLDTLGAALASAGHEAAAFAASRDAVARSREAHARNGAGVGDTYAQVLTACAERHADGRRDDASAWAAEAVAVLRALSVDEPEAHAVALARAEAVRAGFD